MRAPLDGTPTIRRPVIINAQIHADLCKALRENDGYPDVGTKLLRGLEKPLRMSGTVRRSHVQAELESELSNAGFISLGVLHKIIGRESISNYFIEYGIEVESKTVSEIETNASKLFSLLVLRERGIRITEYLSVGICDSSFPFQEEADVPLIGTPEERRIIYDWQWKIPPVLEKARHMEFPLEFLPPFTEEQNISHGAFGYVFRVRVACGHLSDPDSVSS